MKKSICFLLIMILSCFNTKSSDKEDEKYYEIKEKYMKSESEKGFSEFIDFYNNYKKKEIGESKAILDKLYEQGKDEEALKYILNNRETINRTYYLMDLYNEDCKTTKCLERLLKFYDYEYRVTKDIERFSSILGFGKEILGDKKYNSLEDFSIKNNSLYAINIKKTRENAIKDEYKNPKITIMNKQYIILQEKKLKLHNGQNIKIFLIMNKDNDSCLYYKNKDKEFLVKVEIHSVNFPYSVVLKDLNGDNQDEIIIENLMDGIYVFK